MKLIKRKFWGIVSWKGIFNTSQYFIADNFKSAIKKAEEVNDNYTCKEIKYHGEVYSLLKLQKRNELYAVQIDSDILINENREIFVIGRGLNEASNLAWQIYLQECDLTLKEKKTLYIDSVKYISVIYN